eukprot:jgi/Ulvmu1/2293/UM013_0140.1
MSSKAKGRPDSAPPTHFRSKLRPESWNGGDDEPPHAVDVESLAQELRLIKRQLQCSNESKDRLCVQLRRQQAELKRMHNTVFSYEVAFRRVPGGIADAGATASPVLSLLRHKVVELEKKQKAAEHRSTVPRASTHDNSGDAVHPPLGPSQSLSRLGTQALPGIGGAAMIQAARLQFAEETLVAHTAGLLPADFQKQTPSKQRRSCQEASEFVNSHITRMQTALFQLLQPQGASLCTLAPTPHRNMVRSALNSDPNCRAVRPASARSVPVQSSSECKRPASAARVRMRAPPSARRRGHTPNRAHSQSPRGQQHDDAARLRKPVLGSDLAETSGGTVAHEPGHRGLTDGAALADVPAGKETQRKRRKNKQARRRKGKGNPAVGSRDGRGDFAAAMSKSPRGMAVTRRLTEELDTATAAAIRHLLPHAADASGVGHQPHGTSESDDADNVDAGMHAYLDADGYDHQALGSFVRSGLLLGPQDVDRAEGHLVLEAGGAMHRRPGSHASDTLDFGLQRTAVAAVALDDDRASSELSAVATAATADGPAHSSPGRRDRTGSEGATSVASSVVPDRGSCRTSSAVSECGQQQQDTEGGQAGLGTDCSGDGAGSRSGCTLGSVTLPPAMPDMGVAGEKAGTTSAELQGSLPRAGFGGSAEGGWSGVRLDEGASMHSMNSTCHDESADIPTTVSGRMNRDAMERLSSDAMAADDGIACELSKAAARNEDATELKCQAPPCDARLGEARVGSGSGEGVAANDSKRSMEHSTGHSSKQRSVDMGVGGLSDASGGEGEPPGTSASVESSHMHAEEGRNGDSGWTRVQEHATAVRAEQAEGLGGSGVNGPAQHACRGEQELAQDACHGERGLAAEAQCGEGFGPWSGVRQPDGAFVFGSVLDTMAALPADINGPAAAAADSWPLTQRGGAQRESACPADIAKHRGRATTITMCAARHTDLGDSSCHRGAIRNKPGFHRAARGCAASAARDWQLAAAPAQRELQPPRQPPPERQHHASSSTDCTIMGS